MANQIRLVIGIVLWLVAVGWLGGKLIHGFSGAKNGAGAQLTDFTLQPRSQYSLVFHDEYVTRIGDPIFWRDSDGFLVQVGVIRQTESSESQNYDEVRTRWASATFFSNAPPIASDSYLKLYETPQTMSWVARALLPPEKLEEIAEFISGVFRNNASLFVDDLKPIFFKALADTGLVFKDELARTIASRSDDWRALGQRYQSEIIDQDLVPLVNREIWPVIQEELTPVVQMIGEEVWQKASIWRFGWRAMYDTLPLPRQNLANREFQRFVEESALPTISTRVPDLVAAQQRVLNRVVDNPNVHKFIADTFVKLANDSELQALIAQIIRESILENEDFHRQLDAIWNSPEIKRALHYSDARFGSDVETIGEMIFGSPITGVTPEFARILRHRILLKDMRWYVLTDESAHPSSIVHGYDEREANSLVVVYDQTTDDNPFFIEARSRK